MATVTVISPATVRLIVLPPLLDFREPRSELFTEEVSNRHVAMRGLTRHGSVDVLGDARSEFALKHLRLRSLLVWIQPSRLCKSSIPADRGQWAGKDASPAAFSHNPPILGGNRQFRRVSYRTTRQIASERQVSPEVSPNNGIIDRPRGFANDRITPFSQ